MKSRGEALRDYVGGMLSRKRSTPFLEDIAAEFNRYNRDLQIRIADPEVGQVRFTGVFDADVLELAAVVVVGTRVAGLWGSSNTPPTTVSTTTPAIAYDTSTAEALAKKK